MITTRIGTLTGALCLCLIMSGCQGGTSAGSQSSQVPVAEAGQEPDSSNRVGDPSVGQGETLSRSPSDGPYLDVLKMSAEQAEEHLGKPATVSDELGVKKWEYPDLGISIGLYNRQVLFVIQTRGIITEALRIGDSEEKAVQVQGELETSVSEPGAKVGRIFLPQADVKITVKGGRVVRAELLHPGRDN